LRIVVLHSWHLRPSLYTYALIQGPFGKGFAGRDDFLAKARVLNVVGGRILVCGLAASFLTAAAGRGSLQLIERSALEAILDESWKVLEALGKLESLNAIRGEPGTCLRHTTTPLT
jgi:hypothetical protein